MKNDGKVLFMVVTLLVFLATVFGQFAVGQEQEKCAPVVDVAFLVDSSGSIRFRDYRKMKTFVSKMVEKFNISPAGSRVAVVQYSTRATTVIRFGVYTNSQAFETAVQGLRHERGYTRIDLALIRAYNDLFRARVNTRFLVPKIAFVLTDGEQTKRFSYTPLDEASQLLKDVGVLVITIGIGKSVKREELEQIASSKKEVIIAKSFDDLLPAVESLTQTACEDIEEIPTCDSPVDITFIVDSSGSISRTNYKREKAFINAIAQSFGISRTQSRAAVVLFSNSASVKIRFTDYASTGAFQRAVDLLPHERGKTRIDRALEVASRYVLPSARKDVHQIVMVITDGEQTQEDDTKDLKEVSKPLRKAGVQLLVLGVGKGVNPDELRLMVERDEDVLLARSFQDLVANINNLVKSTCSLTEPVPCDIPADLAFIFSSGGIGQNSFLRIKATVKTIAKGFQISTRGSRASVVTYGAFSAVVDVSLGIDSISSTDMFLRAVDSLRYGRDRGDLREALRLAEKQVFSKARGGIAHVAVVFFDEQEWKNSRWTTSLLSLRKAGVRVLLVGVGPSFNYTSLRSLVENDRGVIIIDSYFELLRNSVELANTTCVATVPPPCKYSADVAFFIQVSGNMGSSDFARQKTFVKLMKKSFATNWRFAVVTYGERASVETNLTQNVNISEFEKAVDRIEKDGDGKTGVQLGMAMDLATTEIFSKTRPGITKLAVVLTDGTPMAGLDSSEVKRTLQDSRKADVRVVTLGTGKSVDPKEWRSALQRNQDLIQLQDSHDLMFKIRDNAAAICAAAELLEKPTCVHAVDITFLMDSSDNIDAENFEKQKSLVISIARSFGISPNTSRAAVVLYSDKASVRFRFGDSMSTKLFENTVRDLPHIRGESRMDKAFEVAANDIFPSGRVGIPKIAFVVANGQQASDANLLDVASKTLTKAGVNVVALGVGTEIDSQELRSVVKENDHVLQADSYDQLLLEKRNISQKICKMAAPPPCSSPVDVAFILDSSGSIGRTNYLKQKEFVKQVARSFGVAPGQSQAAMVLYSSTASVQARFGQYATAEEFAKAVDALPYERGLTRIDMALDLASTEIFPAARPGVPKIAILITDGKQTQAKDAKDLKVVSDPLRKAGVRVLAVGIGSGVDADELRSITETDEDVVVAADFTDLMLKLANLTSRACELAGEQKPSCLIPMDLAFLLDSSSSVGRIGYQKQIEFVGLVSRMIDVSYFGSHIGIVSYSSQARLDIPFSESNNSHDLLFIMKDLKFLGGSARIGHALDLAFNDLFTVSSGSRLGVPKVVVVFSYGHEPNTTDFESLSTSVEPYKAEGISVIAVGIGPNAGLQRLRVLVENDRLVLAAHSFKELSDLALPITSLACRVAEPKKVIHPMDVLFLIDTSEGVSDLDFQREKNFIKTVVRSFKISSDHSRVGLMSYSNETEITVNFSDEQSHDSLLERVESLPFLGGQRQFNNALETAAAQFFSPSGSSRSVVQKAAVIITNCDQVSTKGTDHLEESSLLQENDVKVLIIAVGCDGADQENNLQKLVQDADQIFTADSFENLAAAAKRLTVVAADIAAPDECTKSADVAFILDSSDSVGMEDYQLQKDFVKAIAESFGIRPTGSRVGVIIASKDAAVNIKLSDHLHVEDLKESVDKLPYIGGTARIDKALNLATSKLFVSQGGARPGLSKILIIVTTGKQNATLNGELMGVVAQKLLRMGVTVYVIVVGKEVDDKVLGSLVTEEENLFLEDSFKSLMLKTRQLAKMACDNAGFSRCINPVDVAFLVDSSGSLEEEGFNKQKEFIKAVAATLDISPFHSQIGVITYSDRASVEIKLSDHQHQEDLINAVESLKYIGRTTRIDKAIAIATKELMTPGAGRREDIPGVLVILTDGRQTPDSDTTPLDESSSSLEKLGVKTIVVGIGKLADEKGLQKLAGRNKDVFHAPSLELLPNVAQSVATSICEEAAPQSCDVSLDVAILVESSANVPPNDFQNMKDFIKDTVKYLLVFEGEQQVSIILYGSQATTRVAFGQYHSEFDFRKIIDSLPLQKGLARLDKALQFVSSQVFTAKGGARPGVQKVCIVLTNEQRPSKRYSDDVKTAVEPLHQAGVRVIAIGVTSLADWRQLRVLTRDPKDVIRSRSCDSLVAKVSHLFRRTCYKAAYRQCDGIGDVIFAVHSPDGLSPLNYRKEKEFVKRVATTLNIAPGKSRVGLILYSNFATVSAELGDKSTLELFNNLVDGLPQKSGKTRIDRALKLAFSLFHTTGAIRRAVPKILILLASEKQTLVPEVSNLKDAAHPLHKANIRILAVGMGQGFEETDLRTVTRSAKDVFLAPSFEDLFSLSSSISKITCEAAKPPICSEPIDVAFLVDSSGSIGAADFEMQKAFIKAAAGTLPIEKGIAHAGSVVYSDIATVQQSFDQCNGTKSVMQAIDRLPYYGRTTRIDRALSLANTAMFSAAGGCRSHAAKALLLLTDGTQTPALDSIALEQVVKPLKGKKVARLALGTGKKVSASELRRVVDKDDDVMTVDSFDDLLSSLHLVSKKICSSAKIKKCSTPVDIAFLLDSSGSIGERSYQKMKDFVKKVADAFVIGPSTTCAGVIIFGSSATTAVRFADATNNTVFNAAVDALPYMRGETRIDKALQLASAELLNHPSGARVGVAKVVIVLTDGGQSKAPYAMDIQKAVAPLLSAGIRIFAVGIGKNVDDRQLRLMVDDKDDAIMVPSFDGLSVHARQLSIATCESSEIDPCDNTMDVAFLLDSSGSLTPTQFQQSKDFIDLLAASFLKSKVGSRVGLIQFSIVPKIKVWFSDQLTHERFQSVLRKVRYQGGYTRLDRALMLADKKLFKGKEGVRKHIPKIMIVLSDGVNTDAPDAVAFDAAVAPLHRAGVRVFVVATGNEEGRDNLYLLTQRKKDLYRTETYDDLALQLRKISRDTCESGALPICEQVMDVSFIIDSSESVGLKNYHKLLDLVRYIARSLEISPTGSHASVVIFSDTARVQIKLDDHEEILEFNKALRDVPYLGRKTRIDKALRVATVGVFNSRSGMRAGVRRVAVILTEGPQTRTFDSIPLRYAVEPLRRKRVKVFAVGVGNDVRYDELRSLTDSDQNVLMVKTFQGLFSVAEELSNKMCRG